MQTVTRRRIEILADRPLVRRIVDAAAKAGIEHYTLLPAAAGVGHSGAWSEDELTGALSKQLFMAVCGAEAADRFVDTIAPLLDSHGLMLMLGNVEVVRGGRFA
jgi:PII-like signaling protein